MKRFALVALAVLAGVAPAAAADVYRSYKDPDVPVRIEVAPSHAGFYIKGDLGIASGDREITGEVRGERYNENLKDDVAGVTFGPLDVLHVLPFSETGELDTFVFGGELSYLLHNPGSRFGFEFGVGVTGYADDSSLVDLTGRPHDFHLDANGDLVEKNHATGHNHPGPDANSSHDTVDVFAKFERSFDVDFVAKGHLFLDDRLSIYAGGGLSLAQGKLKGGHDNSNTPVGTYDNTYDESVTSLGYVIVAGAQYWATDRLVIGLDYSYKAHEFELNSGSSHTEDGDKFDVLRTTSDNVNINDEVHAIKARVGYKLN